MFQWFSLTHLLARTLLLRVVLPTNCWSAKEGIGFTTYLRFLFQTWNFLSCRLTRLFCLLKLLIQLNSTLLRADSLAKEGLHLLNSDSLLPNFSCTNPSHVLGCPFLGALQSVTVNSVMVITASCC
jgi:hypothetical protein